MLVDIALAAIQLATAVVGLAAAVVALPKARSRRKKKSRKR